MIFNFVYFLFLLLFPSPFLRSLSLALFILSYICLRLNITLQSSVRSMVYREGQFHLRTGHKAQKGRRVIAVLFNLGASCGWGVSATPRPPYSCEKDTLPILQEVVWAPESVLTDVGILAANGIRFPDSPARIESLYWLSYPSNLQ
jgi:hypothetical protein